MAFTKELLDEILKDYNYHGPDDFYGPQGIMKQLLGFTPLGRQH
jgi:hypothetical protein